MLVILHFMVHIWGSSECLDKNISSHETLGHMRVKVTNNDIK